MCIVGFYMDIIENIKRILTNERTSYWFIIFNMYVFLKDMALLWYPDTPDVSDRHCNLYPHIKDKLVGALKKPCELKEVLKFQLWIKIVSFNTCMWCFVYYFSGILWRRTRNISPIDLKMDISLRYKAFKAFRTHWCFLNYHWVEPSLKNTHLT